MTFVPFRFQKKKKLIKIIFGTFWLYNTAPVQENKLSMPQKWHILSSRGVLKKVKKTQFFSQAQTT